MIRHEDIAPVFVSLGLSEFALPAVTEKLSCLWELLIAANKRTNLTAITDPADGILRHFADSLTAARFLPQGARVVDVGCGGGFPSLPLAIARPDLAITALDATAKKLEFVAQAAKTLGLSVTTHAGRAEEFAAGREAFDVSISRAVAALPALSELCLPLVRVGGSFVAMKGAAGRQELADAGHAIACLGGKVEKADTFTLGTAGERFLLLIRKIAPTPTAYPRAFSKIKNHPL